MATSKELPAYSDLEPASIWSFFAEISAVPRPSKKEEKVRARVRKMAESRGLRAREDVVGNLLIEVPASPGKEGTPVVVLQGHLDMVCEKNSGTQHDFDHDPIRLVVDRDRESGRVIVRAEETTLGADNGIGLSLAWAAATSPEVVHGPLEILCTIDEEMGMGGAGALAPDFLRGRVLLNLDCEDDALYVGCAGGCDLTVRWEFTPVPVEPACEFAHVRVSGLRGGHSGGDIHENRGNAVRLLTRVLSEEGVPALHLIELNGGGRRNAIAREASALVAGSSGCLAALRAAAARVQAEWKAATEPDCRIEVEPRPATRSVATVLDDSVRCLRGINALPHGVLALVPEIPGLVQTSNNVATVRSESTPEGRLAITIGCMARSSFMPQLYDVVRQARAAGELAGAEVVAGNAYPGWQPNLKSEVLQVCRRVYASLNQDEAKVKAIHAGLECGIIGDRISGMDMVSFGPDIKGAHSPDERVYVDSVERTWEFLKAVLGELSQG